MDHEATVTSYGSHANWARNHVAEMTRETRLLNMEALEAIKTEHLALYGADEKTEDLQKAIDILHVNLEA